MVGVEWLFRDANFTHCKNAGTQSVGGSVNCRAGVDGSGEGKNILPFPSIEGHPDQAVAVKAKSLFLGNEQCCLLYEGAVCNCTPVTGPCAQIFRR